MTAQKDINGEPQASQQLDEELSKYLKHITNLREVFFTVGFHRSGSSLVGDLLDGHPNMIVSNEAGVIRKYIQGQITSREQFLALIIKNSVTSGTRKNFIASQKKHKNLEIIGDKHSGNNLTSLISKRHNNIEKVKEFVGLPIKFLFTIRNPYDMVSSMITTVPDWQVDEERKNEQVIKYFGRWSRQSKLFFEYVPADKIFIIRNEDFIANPSKMMEGVCDFLGVDKIPSYIEDCISAVYRIPSKSRERLNWGPQIKAQVATLIEEYEFFDGYSWDN